MVAHQKACKIRKGSSEFVVTLRREGRSNMKLPEGTTPDFLRAVCHSFILDIYGSCLFPQGKFCPAAASGVEQGLASLPHGSSCLYLETNKRSLGEFFTLPVHKIPIWWLGPFWRKNWAVSSCLDKQNRKTQESSLRCQQEWWHLKNRGTINLKAFGEVL